MTSIPRNRPEVIARYRAMQYRDYLKTDWWRRIKIAAIRRAGYKCQHCNLRRRLDVHHLTYDRLGTEDDADLVALCEPCHEQLHIP